MVPILALDPFDFGPSDNLVVLLGDDAELPLDRAVQRGDAETVRSLVSHKDITLATVRRLLEVKSWKSLIVRGSTVILADCIPEYRKTREILLAVLIKKTANLAEKNTRAMDEDDTQTYEEIQESLLTALFLLDSLKYTKIRSNETASVVDEKNPKASTSQRSQPTNVNPKSSKAKKPKGPQKRSPGQAWMDELFGPEA